MRSHLLLVAILFAAVALGAGAEEPKPLTAEQSARLEEGAKLNARAVQLYGQGKAGEAIALAKQALAIRENVLGPKHLDVAESLNNLGALHASVGDHAAARPCYERALAIRQEIRGPKHLDIAQSLNNLGALLESMGDYAAARSFHERALAIYKEIHGPKHPLTATSLNNLGALNKATGDYAAARSCYEQALAIRQEVLGPKHPDTAQSLNNLGALFLATGDYADARPFYEQALAIHAEVLGPKHPHTATSLNNMGALLDSLGDYAAARPYYEQALAIYQEVLGPKHPAVAQSLNNLGFLYKATGKYAAARTYFEQALAIRQEVLGPKHPDTAESLNNLASLLQATGDYAAARPFCDQTFAIHQDVFGPKHPHTATSLNNLGGLLNSAGDYAAARPFFEKALAIRQEVLGPKHPDTLRTLNNLATLDAATGKWNEAAEGTTQARRGARWHVARALPSLSPREQLTFLTAEDEFPFHAALTLGWTRRGDAAIAAQSAAWIINGKAAAHEAFAQTALMARASGDPAITAQVRDLAELRERLARLAIMVPVREQAEAHRARVEELERQDEALSRRVSQQTGEILEIDPWVEINNIRKALQPDALLIDIARFNVFDFSAKGTSPKWRAARYVAWIVPPAGRREVKIVDLGDADTIDAAIRRAREQIQPSEESDEDPEKGNALAELSALILHPLIGEIGAARSIILSPDASLWLAPWAALPLPDGRYSIEKYSIRYVTSGRDLVRRRRTVGATNAPTIMADPDYDLPPLDARFAAKESLNRLKMKNVTATNAPLLASRAIIDRGGRSIGRASRLPGSALEAKLIEPNLKRAAGASPAKFIGEQAGEAVFKAIERPKILVLATHGFFLEDQEPKRDDSVAASSENHAAPLSSRGEPIENPLLRCGLLLAGCNQRRTAEAGDEDGVLTGMEVVGADLRGTELVVLSACDTGVGKIRNGEGVAGLRQAFQLAGAEAVIATLWKVPDEESAQLMNLFFKHLADGQSKTDALRNAQLARITSRRAKGEPDDPVLWAAYTLTGH